MEKIESNDALRAQRAAEIAQAKKEAEESLAYVILGEHLPLPVKYSSGEVIVAAGAKVTKEMIRAMVDAYPDIDIEAGIVHRKIMDNLHASYQKIQEIDERPE